jgi:cytochrome P450
MLASMRFDSQTRRLALDPRDPAFFSSPEAAYARLHASPGPVFWEDYGFWCFPGHASVSGLLRDRRFGRQILHVATREELGWPERPEHLKDFDALERHSLLELEPPGHTRLRALVNRAFVSRQVARLEPRIVEMAGRLVDGLAPGDLIAGFSTPLAVGVIAELIGAPAGDAAVLLDWSHRMVAMYQFAPTRADEEAANKASRSFAAYLRGLIALRRLSPRDDLISQLVAVDGLGEDELVSIAVLLLNAGHEATVHALGNGVKALLEQGVRFDGSETAVEELLRFESPLHMFTRYALEDVEIEGVRLSKGERIGLMLGAANRDPAAFSDPDRLDLARQPNPHVAFGAGIHFCVGAPLARRELRVGLNVLFGRLPGLRLAAPPSWRDAYHFHGLTGLEVSW